MKIERTLAARLAARLTVRLAARLAVRLTVRPAVLLSVLGILALMVSLTPAAAEDDPFHLQLRDVFELEWADDPQISPDGSQVVYERSFMDVMHDRRRSNLWIVDTVRDTAGDPLRHQPLTTGLVNHGSPRWSPDGGRLLYVASDPAAGGGAQLWVRWMDSGRTARLTQLPSSPAGLAWSPDGKAIAFTRFVESTPEPMAKLPTKPEGAQWADPALVIEDLVYRADGAGYLPQGHRQLFVVSAEGGTPRQVTHGEFDVGGTPVWTKDGSALFFASNRNDDWRYDPVDGEIYRVELATGEITALTDRNGPDGQPALSPDGSMLAWVGFDDRLQGYQISRLSVAEIGEDGSLGESKPLAADLDRSVGSPVWSADGQGLYFSYNDHGNGKIGHVSLASGATKVVAETAAARRWVGPTVAARSPSLVKSRATARSPTT